MDNVHHYFIIINGKAVTSLEGYLLLFTSYDLAEKFCKAMGYNNYTIHKTLIEKEALKRSFNFYRKPFGKEIN